MPLLIVLIGVILLIFMIVKLKLNTFVSLIITSFIVALMLHLPLAKPKFRLSLKPGSAVS